MTLPANIRINARVPFPALVIGSGPVVVSKANGIWTVGANYQQLSPELSDANLSSSLIAIYDPIAKQFLQITVGNLAEFFFPPGALPQRSMTGSGNLPIVLTDSILNLNLSAPLTIPMPSAASRVGSPLLFFDVGRTWGGANTPTFTPAGSDTFDGLSSITAGVNAGWIEFIPMNDGVNSGYKVRGIYQ